MLPQEFTERMQEMLGEEFAAFLCSYDNKKYQSLRVNPLKANVEEFLQKTSSKKIYEK